MIYFSAYEEYKEAFAAGDDGRPDWLARKSCNYMTKTIEVRHNGIQRQIFVAYVALQE